MLSIPITTTSDDYTDATTFGGGLYIGGWVTIANAPILARLKVGKLGAETEQDNVYLTPGTYPISGSEAMPVRAFSARSKIAGSPAMFWGTLVEPNDAGVFAGTPFTSIISAAGQVTAAPVYEPGMIFMYGGGAAPVNFVLCDGTHYDGTTTLMSPLWGAIGLKYGGSGQADFAVPDYRGRGPVGVGTHADVNDRGKSDGLVVGSRRPKHKSSVIDVGHVHQFYGIFAAGTLNDPFVGGATYGINGNQFTQSAVTGITVGPQTGAEPIDTHAYLTCNFIIAL